MKPANAKLVRITSMALALNLILVGALVAVQPAHMEASPFTDVPVSHWGFSGILEAYQDNVMTGTSHDPSTGERQFSPAAPLTMAEWSVMIYRAFYADEPYAGWGSLSSIQFNGPASRTAMAVTIANLMKDKGITADASKVEAAKAQITPSASGKAHELIRGSSQPSN